MQVTKAQLDPCTFELDFDIEAERVDKGYERAFREFASFTNVPGFRPGKAPRSVVERYIDAEKLRDRAMELIAVTAYHEALKQEGLTPYGEPEVEFGDINRGNTWQFKAIVSTPPSVDLGDYSGMKVERPVLQVTDEAVSEAIDGLRDEHARQVNVEGRGVIDGDWVIAELASALDGEEMPEPKRTLIRLGNNIPGFDEQILGLRIGEPKTFQLAYPDDYQDQDRRGKLSTFEVSVQSISERVQPELTDQWVKDVSSLENVEALRAHMRERLGKQFAETADQIAENRVVEQLAAKATLAFPRVMVTEEVQSELSDLLARLEQRGGTYEEYLDANGTSREQHLAQLKAQAEQRVRIRLVLRELARREDLRIADKDIDSEFDRIYEEYDPEDKAVRQMLRNERRRTAVANVLVQRKLHDCLMNLAEISDVPVERNPQPPA